MNNKPYNTHYQTAHATNLLLKESIFLITPYESRPISLYLLCFKKMHYIQFDICFEEFSLDILFLVDIAIEIIRITYLNFLNGFHNQDALLCFNSLRISYGDYNS